MTNSAIQFLDLGEGPSQRQIAYAHQTGRSPGLFWLGGYNSDMQGNKAQALVELGNEHGFAVTRFDYMAHGQSTGDFHQANISLWLEDAIAVFNKCCEGPQILVGSSMGGWLAMLLNQHIRAQGAGKIVGMILIAPAVDMTRELVPQRFSQSQLAEMKSEGFIEVPSKYGDGPYIYTQNLVDDGEKHLLLGAPIETGCPVHILQGQQDPDVPASHAERLLQHFMLDEAQLAMVPDGDHRLSRPEDLDLLKRSILQFV